MPKDLTLPITVVTQDTLDAQLKNTEKGGVTNVEYSQADVADLLAKAGK